jgi:large subunit ribosomal protein L17
MRHRCKRNNLNRAKDQQVALMRSLSRELITYGEIKTTLAKAKVLRSFVEKLLTKAIKAVSTTDEVQKLHQIRLIRRDLASDVIEHILNRANQLKGRPGGYTRIIRTMSRAGDNTKMSIIQILEAAA